MDGIVNFLKPSGMTSHDAIGFFRRLTGIKKIGHTGTLDPMAIGVLPICIGRAARLIEYLDHDKKYRAVMKLGFTSETGDIWGDDLDKTEFSDFPDTKTIESTFQEFQGIIVQQIPAFSAHKHNGRKLYEYARAGDEIPVKKKQVNINSISVKTVYEDKNEIMFDVDCSKGTYVRTICTDIGEKIGTGAVMSFLLRTSAGKLDIKKAVTMEELESEMKISGCIRKYLINPGILLQNIKKILLNKEETKKFINGLSIDKQIKTDDIAAVYSCTYDCDRFIGIGKGKNNKLKAQKVIFPEMK